MTFSSHNDEFEKNLVKLVLYEKNLFHFKFNHNLVLKVLV